MNNIEQFLFELRNSDDSIYKIFTKGSCFRLYNILVPLLHDIKPFWSDVDAHAIIWHDGNFYDIGGKVNLQYLQDKGYYEVPKALIDGYSLMKYVNNEDDKFSVTVEKYRK